MSLYCIDEGLRGVMNKTTCLRRVRATTPVGCTGLELENRALKRELRRRCQEKPQVRDTSHLAQKLERPLNLLRELEAQSRECSMRVDDVDELLARLEEAIRLSPEAALAVLEELRVVVLCLHYQSEAAESQLRFLAQQNEGLRLELEALHTESSRGSSLAAVCAFLQQRAAEAVRGLTREQAAAFTHVTLPLQASEKSLVSDVLRSLLQAENRQREALHTIQNLSNEIMRLREMRDDETYCSADTVKCLRS